MGVFLKPFVRRMILRLVYCLIVLIHEIRANNVTETQSQRGKRQFSLFTIVSFPNDQCSAKSASTTGVTYGTCLSSTECNSQSGTVDGNCASGFGVCYFFCKLLWIKCFQKLHLCPKSKLFQFIYCYHHNKLRIYSKSIEYRYLSNSV